MPPFVTPKDGNQKFCTPEKAPWLKQADRDESYLYREENHYCEDMHKKASPARQ